MTSAAAISVVRKAGLKLLTNDLDSIGLVRCVSLTVRCLVIPIIDEPSTMLTS